MTGSCFLVTQPADCEPPNRRSGQSPYPLSTTRSRRAADISPRCAHHGFEGLRCVRSGGLTAAMASSLLIRKAEQESVIRAKPRPGRWLFSGVSEECRFEDGSRWRGIRVCMATVLPTAHDPRRVRRSGCTQPHATESPPDVRTPRGCYPEQSSAAPFIAQFANLIPGTSGKVRLQSFALESGLPKPETAR